MTDILCETNGPEGYKYRPCLITTTTPIRLTDLSTQASASTTLTHSYQDRSDLRRAYPLLLTFSMASRFFTLFLALALLVCLAAATPRAIPQAVREKRRIRLAAHQLKKCGAYCSDSFDCWYTNECEYCSNNKCQ
ncbi:unnamed protein product [Chondrus crispus]|uniref:Uncharacterized protein n=1 Tax=Chondrus crispus TaxID=2769 RepID=R7QKK1_CHOCR|nr:unnamed protein product [Chondrus crispus]CDF38308.1 unnamed protein product [Chondrus crispus]|eukprot:XP_005718193.1 unnamed protein product [Chondrus crispus]